MFSRTSVVNIAIFMSNRSLMNRAMIEIRAQHFHDLMEKIGATSWLVEITRVLISPRSKYAVR